MTDTPTDRQAPARIDCVRFANKHIATLLGKMSWLQLYHICKNILAILPERHLWAILSALTRAAGSSAARRASDD